MFSDVVSCDLKAPRMLAKTFGVTQFACRGAHPSRRRVGSLFANRWRSTLARCNSRPLVLDRLKRSSLEQPSDDGGTRLAPRIDPVASETWIKRRRGSPSQSPCNPV